MKQKGVRAFLLPFLATFAFTAGFGVISAHALGNPEQSATRLQHRFDSKAKLLGVSSNEVKDVWADGKSIRDIAKEKGITQEQLRKKMKNAHEQAQKERIQSLVSKGVITQTQADKHTTFEQTRKKKKPIKNFLLKH